MIRVDASQVEALAALFAQVPGKAVALARPVVQKGALNIKNDWRRAWSGLDSAPYLASAVTYDITDAGSLVTAEIGPDKSLPQGALGNLLEFGSVNNAPHPGGLPAAQAEEPRFAEAAERLAIEALGLS